MKKHTSLFPILSLILLSGCAQLDRHSDSGYSEKTRGGARFSGVRKNTDLSNLNRSPIKVSEKARLQSLESSMTTKKEVEQYSKMLPWFENDQERIEFLQQGSFENKQEWLNQKNFLARPHLLTEDMKDLVEAQDIAVGMPQTLVKKSWGDPDVVEVSGNPQFRNERWRYNRYVSTSDGYKAEKKAVYFEGGKVVGWEVE